MNKKRLITILSFSLLLCNNIFAEEEPAVKPFSEKIDSVVFVSELESLIPEAIESNENMSLFVEKIDDFVDERTKDQIQPLRRVINYTIYNPLTPAIFKNQLENLRTRAVTPLTELEKINGLREKALDVDRVKKLKENQIEVMQDLIGFVMTRTDETRTPLLNLLSTIRMRDIITDTNLKEQLIEFIDIVPQPTSLYEKVYSLYIKLKKLSDQEAMRNLFGIMKEYMDATEEGKTKVKEKFTLLLNTIIYNPKFTEEQKKQTQTWLREVSKIKTEPMEEMKEPQKYTEKILFYYKNALEPEHVAIPKKRTALLQGLIALEQDKVNASPGDLERLLKTLKYLQLRQALTPSEKIQLSQLISNLEKEVSVSDMISKIYSLLNKAETEENAKKYIVTLIEKIKTNLVEQMKKENKIPSETEMLDNLLFLYIIDSARYAGEKAEIEKWQKELNTAKEAAKKLQQEAATITATTTGTQESSKLQQLFGA